MKKIIISVTSDVVTDQRVIRIAGTLNKMGYDVYVVGRKLPDSFPARDFGYRVNRFRMIFHKGPFFYIFYNFRLFLYLFFRKADILLASDLDTLPANYIVSRLKKITLVYDSHEYFTEVPELVNRKRVQRFWLRIENAILPNLEYAITVSQSIAEEYYSKYSISMKVIRNLPECFSRSDIPKELPGLNGHKIILYQGTLNKGRGLDLAIKAMEFVSGAILVIVGDGPERNNLENLSSLMMLKSRVRFLGRLLPDELRKITLQADLGISFEESKGLNYYYALPNKIFDYIHAIVPVLVSPFPEMEKLVMEYGVGEVLKSFDPFSIATQLEAMLTNDAKRAEWKENLINAAKELCWEKEENKLSSLFKSIKN